MPQLSRRSLLISTASLGLVSALPLHAETLPPIHVAKGTGCECCSAWVEHLRSEGFTVTEEELYGMLLINYKLENGIPQRMTSCHTGKIDGYMIEGHVPAADIRRLLQERPDAIGLVVPGMPYGSPGMGDETDRDAYEVFLIARDGTTSVFTSYPEA
ncbi:DUF411 domain-containing protein [Rhodobacter ferrooxidans]|jgi:hypothetical protein|uniref:Metal-binding protein n=1 Tax=Rhodobacter ferrooxidans TaxID=371731 RepID=C8S1W0_9RHOB|nr:DUF411 domain-containing protein [Rhodobacter sp. SW2]EEW25058.1 protein of unknown function DUF411 [Rhodobacter sp. SW2]